MTFQRRGKDADNPCGGLQPADAPMYDTLGTGVRSVLLLTVGVCLAVGAVSAEQAAQPGRANTPATTASGSVADAGSGSSATSNAIVGTTRSFNNAPVAGAKLRLRSLTTGRIEATVDADAEGRFVFRSIEPGTYVVEMLEASGVVLATSEAVTVASNEVLQTLVRLPGRIRSLGWWAGSTASTAVSAASGIGVLAVNDISVPVSPER